MKTYNYEQWKAEGIKRFGKDRKEWQFICPSCGHIQTQQDFIKLGIDKSDVIYECVGRHNGNMKPYNGDSTKGCDWASYGLLKTLGKGVKIVLEDGTTEVEIFDFAPDIKN